jgi:hypothetical protein
MELRVFVYFPIDPYQQVSAFEPGNKLANVFVVRHGIFPLSDHQECH